ncbi:hypothetical protein BJI69_18155 [Luteibacter rhizovicinus DSM 16549]|uniref:Uncharacterized protein n=2 Tax=Luteibacter rhizovicinus TaxID=242606 RepID=A0A1L3EXA0_9GAMM|nr:hypothetical protein BJI69_18155 [Luteibacter rhizovicinus DSM 16549]
MVILDTMVARSLGSESRPEWLAVLGDMSRNGYSFSLADTTTGELTLQARRKQFSFLHHKRMMTALRKLLNPNLRSLPSRVDLQGIIGASSAPPLEETLELSRIMWRLLNDPSLTVPGMGPPLEQIRDEERADWPAWIKQVARKIEASGVDLAGCNPTTKADELALLYRDDLDAESDVTPPMSVRRHLEIRYRLRQVARSVQKKEPYVASNPRKINDGIDVDLYQYFVLPAFVLSEDKIFFEKISDITSFQKDWFMRPAELAAKWKQGLRPRPVWPVD